MTRRTRAPVLAVLLGPLLFLGFAPIAGADHTPPAPCNFGAPVFAKVWTPLAGEGARNLVDIINASGDPLALAISLNSGGVTWRLLSGDAATDGHVWHEGSATPSSPALLVTQPSPFDRLCLEILYVGPGVTSGAMAVSKVSDDYVRYWLDRLT